MSKLDLPKDYQPYMSLMNGYQDDWAERKRVDDEHEDSYFLAMMVGLILSPLVIGLFIMVGAGIWDDWWSAKNGR